MGKLKDLAEKCQVEQCQIWGIESGKSVTTKTLERIINYFSEPVYNDKGITLSGFFALCEQVDLIEEELSLGFTDKELKEELNYKGTASSIGEVAQSCNYLWFPSVNRWIHKNNISDLLSILPKF